MATRSRSAAAPLGSGADTCGLKGLTCALQLYQARGAVLPPGMSASSIFVQHSALRHREDFLGADTCGVKGLT